MDRVFAFALMLFIPAICNWFAGDRSIVGKRLVLRDGKLWVAARWFGLGAFIASAAIGNGQPGDASWAALVGASILIFGTARRTEEREPFSTRASSQA